MWIIGTRKWLPGWRAGVTRPGSGGRYFDAGDLNFNAAIVRMVILANLVSKVDNGALLQTVLSAAPSPVPADAAHGPRSRMASRRQFQPHMPFFHPRRGTEQANSASHEDRLLVSMSQWLKASP